MIYVCLRCRKEVDTESLDRRIRCPYCGSKILMKVPKGRVRKVKAL